MVTTPHPILTDEEKALAAIEAAEREAAWVRAERIARLQSTAHAVLTGSDSLPWRRPILFVAVGIGLAVDGAVGGVIGAVGLILLAYTDNTTEVVEA